MAAQEGEQRTDAQQPQRDFEHPELSEEGKAEVHRMASAYRDKPTAVMPGTNRTITGTAINEWLDDDGDPKFGDPEERPFADGTADDQNDTVEAADSPGNLPDEQREPPD
jgi:hypothetical protein